VDEGDAALKITDTVHEIYSVDLATKKAALVYQGSDGVAAAGALANDGLFLYWGNGE